MHETVLFCFLFDFLFFVFFGGKKREMRKQFNLNS